jgi:HK97 family phage major capsid protein
MRSTERYAEYGQVYYRAHVRADIAVRDAKALVLVKASAT